MTTRSLVLLSCLALAAPVAAFAQSRDNPRTGGTTGYAVPRDESPAHRAGYERGVRGGEEDGRRNQAYDYQRNGDYRAADAGYRREYGDRERYRVDFRIGFEIGYRDGYGRYRSGAWRPGDGQPPWANGRGRGPAGYGQQAYRTGFNDGYDEGLRDAQRRRRYDPTDTGRYRSADRGYGNTRGPREEYRYWYREGFRDGYDRGYQDGRRYDGRYDPRYGNKPWWWPW